MFVKIANIWNLNTITQEMAQRGEVPPLAVLASVKMSAAKSYQLNKQIAAIKSEAAQLDVERVKLIQRLGVEQKDADGNVTGHSIAQNSEAWRAFVAEVEELCANEIEIPGEPLALSDLGDVQISGEALAAIEFLIEAEAKPVKVTNIKQGRKKKAA